MVIFSNDQYSLHDRVPVYRLPSYLPILLLTYPYLLTISIQLLPIQLLPIQLLLPNYYQSYFYQYHLLPITTSIIYYQLPIASTDEEGFILRI
jgi:hypothetical protein